MKHATLAILAGGAGTRMGMPKTQLTLHGKPILNYLAERFAWDGPTLLITAPNREHPTGINAYDREACDPIQGQGPLRGVLTALENADTDLVVITTVDMPGVQPMQLHWLLDQLSPDTNGLLLTRNGRLEPFPSAYTQSAAQTIRQQIATGKLAMRDLLQHPGFRAIEAPSDWPTDTWTNLNHPADVEAFEQRRLKMLKWTSTEGAVETIDELAAEDPLEIRVQNKPISITMRTPGHDAELAAGFLLSEGLIHQKTDLLDIRLSENTANILLSPGITIDLGRLTRHVFASSSCGICGKASIDSIRQSFPKIESPLRIPAPLLLSLPEKLKMAQATFSRTGGLHAAGLFDAAGNLLISREDVGRHNAVDKVLGHALLTGIDLSAAILLVSGRTSFEIIQKALAGRIPIIAAVSAPSSLAAEFAEETGQTLVGFLRDQRMNIYAGAWRINFE